jgi:excinuclease ABC subunit C
LRTSIDQIKISELPRLPGVYIFYDKNDQPVYVGKARELNKRLSSYFRSNLDSLKTQAMMKQAEQLEYILTHTENEALILENNLIKKHKPPYNILLRDDKSYPYIQLTAHKYPQIKFHRGKQNPKGQYFGPFASTHAVQNTLKLIQKVFPVRQCDDTFFNNRSRPCLQYQIKRCTAPCVNLIDQQAYNEDVNKLRALLQGKSGELTAQLSQEMMQHSERLEYEKATLIRNQIRELNHILEKQNINSNQINHHIDIIALGRLSGKSCIQIAFIRRGWQYGSKSIILQGKKISEESDEQLLEVFISQYYQNKPRDQIPNEIVTNAQPNNHTLLQKALSESAQHKVSINHKARSERLRWLETASLNAQQTLIRLINDKELSKQRMHCLQQLIELPKMPQHIECFDISHTFGQATKGSCVVFKQGQPSTKDYRMMDIHDIKESDDYAAMKQALHRRYKRLKEDAQPLPDLIIVDGGKGQGKMAKEILDELELQHLTLLAVAKGVSRKAGEETLFLPQQNNREIQVTADNEGLHLIQHIRDEAHRFAITGHRKKRSKLTIKTELDKIPGVGEKTRQRLLQHFGGIKEIKKTSIQNLTQVKGISPKLATIIYNYYHE